MHKCGTSGHMPLPTEAREGCSGLVGEAWVHTSSMVESTADDHLTLDSGTNVCCEQRCCDMLIAVSRTLPRAAMQTIGFGC